MFRALDARASSADSHVLQNISKRSNRCRDHGRVFFDTATTIQANTLFGAGQGDVATFDPSTGCCLESVGTGLYGAHDRPQSSS